MILDARKSRPPHFGVGEVCAGQRGIGKVRIREVSPTQVRVGEVSAEVEPTGALTTSYVASEIGIREVGLAQVCSGKSRRVEMITEDRIREVLADEIRAGKIVVYQVDSGQIVGQVAGRRVELGNGDAAVP